MQDNVFLLPAELTIYEVGEVYSEFKSLAKDEDSLLLDGSQLLEIDCAGFQLLSWLSHERNGHRIINPSSQLSRYLARFQPNLTDATGRVNV